MVINITDYIRHKAMESPLLMSAYKGEMPIPDNSSIVKYPYINVDAIKVQRTDYLKKYEFRIYICDRNEPFIAYSKTEQICVELMTALEIENYEYVFFRNDYQDEVHGVFLDIQIDVDKDCVEFPNYDFENVKYKIENGVYVK